MNIVFFLYREGYIRSIAVKCKGINILDCYSNTRKTLITSTDWIEAGHTFISDDLFDVFQGEKIIQ